MKSFYILLGLVATSVMTLSSCEERTKYPGVPTENSPEVTRSGLRYTDLVVGTGASPEHGSMVTVHYTGFLMDSTKFDSSVDSGDPLTIPIGVGRVIAGWDEGIMEMKVGGMRKLIIPSHLAYGTNGLSGVIPPGADLVFDVELLAVRSSSQ
jgi:peptidylprolyl isomerase